ncbi:MAG: arylesterase [Minwuia sp.]|nr:arylesterase [Minwuia sp.]
MSVISPRLQLRYPAQSGVHDAHLRYGFTQRTINGLLLFVTMALFVTIFWSGSALAASKRVVMFGDSITAGYGLPPSAALPRLLAERLNAEGLDVMVENAGVSGDTTAGGLSRLGWAVQGQPDLVIVALGGNDGLRGIDPAETRRNMAAIIGQLQDRDIPVLVAGMLAPPNLGKEYAAQFNPLFGQVADAADVAFYPFLLDGVAAEPSLNQADGIHPNAEGAAIIADRMADPVRALLQ